MARRAVLTQEATILVYPPAPALNMLSNIKKKFVHNIILNKKKCRTPFLKRLYRFYKSQLLATITFSPLWQNPQSTYNRCATPNEKWLAAGIISWNGVYKVYNTNIQHNTIILGLDTLIIIINTILILNILTLNTVLDNQIILLLWFCYCFIYIIVLH